MRKAERKKNAREGGRGAGVSPKVTGEGTNYVLKSRKYDKTPLGRYVSRCRPKMENELYRGQEGNFLVKN